MFESIRLSVVPEQQRVILRESSSTRPVLRIVEENGIRAVVKDFSPNGFLFRNIFGRFLIWRESRAYRKLHGIKGIPTLYRSIGGIALVMEEISGKNLESIKNTSELPGAFFRNLQSLIESIHDRGIAHCDLKRAPNILLGDDGMPYIVDWSASISKGEFRFYPLYLIYRRFIRDDLDAVTKIRLKYRPESVGPEEKSRYYHRGRTEVFIRTLRNKMRDFLQRFA